MEPYELDLSEAIQAISQRQLSARELLTSQLRRIQEQEPHLQAFSDVYADEAQTAAEDADAATVRGDALGPLHGIPIGVKDVFDVGGHPTLANSRVRRDHVAARDATLIDRLRQTGALILGKTNTHEFALGVTSPPTRNPWNTGYMPGGSSGGSGAAVASGELAMALGSDTGGSVRGPASLCGVVGFKPTYGLLPTEGMVPLSWSLDHAGVLVRSAQDAMFTLEFLTNSELLSRRGAKRELGDSTTKKALTGVRIGVPSNHFFDDLTPDIEAGVNVAVQQLADRTGAQLVEVVMPFADRCLATLFGIALPEAASYHSRSLREQPEDYSSDIRLTLEASSLLTADDYITALRSRQLICASWREVFNQIDVLVAPTDPAPALPVGQESLEWPSGRIESLGEAYSRLTGPANLLGAPCVSVPCGLDKDGLPFGIQFLGRPFDDYLVLQVAGVYEALDGWARRLPVDPVISQ